MIYAGGSDIYDRRDSFRFATREGNSGGQIIAQVVALITPALSPRLG